MDNNFSIYSILNEAPEDTDPKQDTANNDQNDDNFNIDTSLDDLEKDIDDTGGTDNTNNDGNDGDNLDLNGDEEEGGEDAGSPAEEEDEPVDSNTDFFASLTSEEQAIKISQLKKQFNNLYTNCDELIEKVSNIETNENNIIPISRINSTMENMKTYIADYLYHVFANKSYYENDVMFNRFLSVFKSVNNILEDIFKESDRENRQNTH